MATAILSTVTKAFRLLALFQERGELSLSECARELGIPRPSAHRLLVTLESTGMVERTSAGRYQIGIRLFEMGATAPARCRFYDASCRPLEDLVDACHTPSHLVVLEGDETLYLVKAHRTATDLTRTRAGSRRPLHATAAGKVLLAHADPAVLDRVLALGLPRLTRHTVTLPHRLLAELAEIRRTGFSSEREESQLGCAAVSVPVRDPGGEVVAAIGITGNALAVDRLATYVPELRRAALCIEANLAHADELATPA